MKIGYIYKIVSPTNRVYIGKTFNLKKRIECYRGLSCKSQRLLFASLNKYGWSDHSFVILFEGFCDNIYLCELEKNYIKEFNSFKGLSDLGMNLTLGGEGCLGFKHSDATKKMISDIKKNSERTEKEILAYGKRKGSKLDKNEEWIKNNSESIKKKIYQYDINGYFIREWKSAKDVELELGFCRKNISANLRGKSNKAYNFIWMYKDSKLKVDDIVEKLNKKRHCIKVLNKESGIIYESILDASKENNISYMSLYKILSSIEENEKYVKYEEKNIDGL